MERLKDLTSEQIEKIANNYILSVSDGYVQFLGISKITNTTTNYLGNPMIEVRTKLINKFGKKINNDIYILLNSNEISGYFDNYERRNIVDMLSMEKIDNKEFELSFEDAIIERDKREAIYKHNKFVESIKSLIKYNLKQRRKASASKRSYKKYGVEKLESILPELSDIEQNYLQQIIDSIILDEEPKKSVRDIISSFTGVKRELLITIEKSFETQEKRIFDNVLNWFRNNEDFKHLDEEGLIKETKYYIDIQKSKLFLSIIKYLNFLDITEAKNLYFKNTPNGFEGEWLLTLESGETKLFSTTSIIAEGYIQRAHYRYLVKLN